jgi:hypothetical protein
MLMDIEAMAILGGKIVAGATTLGGAGVVAWKGVKGAFNGAKNAQTFIEKTQKTNDLVEDLSKKIDKLVDVQKVTIENQARYNVSLQRISEQVSDIRKEVTYNGGHSGKDIMRRIESQQNANWELSAQPQFKCNSDGHIIGANLAMLDIVKIGIDEAKGDGLFMKAANPDGIKKAIINTIQHGANLLHVDVTLNGVKGTITARIIRDTTGKALDLYAVFNKAT